MEKWFQLAVVGMRGPSLRGMATEGDEQNCQNFSRGVSCFGSNMSHVKFNKSVLSKFEVRLKNFLVLDESHTKNSNGVVVVLILAPNVYGIR